MLNSIKICQCKNCEQLFFLPRTSRKRFCSEECRRIYHAAQSREWWRVGRLVTIKICPICGTEFKKEGSRKYCSITCAYKGYKNANLRSELKKKRYLKYLGIQELGSWNVQKQLQRIEEKKIQIMRKQNENL